MTQTISIPLGGGSVQLPADMVIKAALEHAFCSETSTPNAGELVPNTGEYWQGEGGFNGGLFHGGDRPYYLIVADIEFEAEYGGYGHQTEAADSPWDGEANTLALLGDSKDHPAAKKAAAHQKDDHSDFYLSARRELQVLEANMPGLFAKAYHWSSTQYSAHRRLLPGLCCMAGRAATSSTTGAWCAQSAESSFNHPLIQSWAR